MLLKPFFFCPLELNVGKLLGLFRAENCLWTNITLGVHKRSSSVSFAVFCCGDRGKTLSCATLPVFRKARKRGLVREAASLHSGFLFNTHIPCWDEARARVGLPYRGLSCAVLASQVTGTAVPPEEVKTRGWDQRGESLGQVQTSRAAMGKGAWEEDPQRRRYVGWK